MKKKFKIFALITSLISAAIFLIHLINRLLLYISTANGFLHDLKGDYYDWRFGSLYYEKHGKGSPILLVHDMTASSSSYEWHNLVDELSKTHTVYVLDLLGCGRSDKPNLAYTRFLYVQMITDFIKHNISASCDVMACGTSSSFVLAAAANDSDVIKQIILINPESIVELAKIPTKKTKALRLLINTPIVGTFLYSMFHSTHSIGNEFRNYYFSNARNVKDCDIACYCEAAHLEKMHSKYLFSSIIGRYVNLNILPFVEKIDNSIFIVVGDNLLDGLNIAEQYKEFIPSAEIIRLEKSKHLPHLENPALFLSQLNFILETEKHANT